MTPLGRDVDGIASHGELLLAAARQEDQAGGQVEGRIRVRGEARVGGEETKAEAAPSSERVTAAKRRAAARVCGAQRAPH